VIGPDHPPEFVAGLPNAYAAAAFAERVHDGQRRKVDGAPFILHPLEVGSLLFEAGAPDDVIAAGILHDTLEKTGTDESELSDLFGGHVAQLVRAVSEDERIESYARRKAELRAQVADGGPEALMVFAADKLSKARELRLAPAVVTPIRDRQLRHYRHCLVLLQQRLPDSPLVVELAMELQTVTERLAPHTAFSHAS
jgi:(p)ppGpp synthase/HD superfamily hydrolase